MNQSNIQLFAVSSKNLQTQKESSSGGSFSELAEYIISKGGVVFGAAFNDKLELKHTCAKTKEQLTPLRGSKYVESNIGSAYTEALSIASQGRLVLFSGTPCQIAGMNMLLEKSDLTDEQKRGFFTCDIICHGVAPKTVFQQYIAFLTEKYHSPVIRFGFRDKREGWESSGVVAKFADGQEYFKKHFEDSYMNGYFKHLYLREGCYECKFAKIPRQGDLTLGDFWGVPKELYDKKGVSVVSVNTPKGAGLFGKLENINKTPVSLEMVLSRNPCFVEHSFVKPPERDGFSEILAVKGYNAAAEKYLKPSFTTKSIMAAKKILR
jgi:coenzyme F420-reducing hydrogenase beta subunit